MVGINDIKKKEIIKFLEKNIEKTFTLNQIKEAVKIHIYKAELLMYQLMHDQKVIMVKHGKFTFWGIKK